MLHLFLKVIFYFITFVSDVYGGFYAILTGFSANMYIAAHCRNQSHFVRLADWEGIMKVGFSSGTYHL